MKRKEEKKNIETHIAKVKILNYDLKLMHKKE